MPRIVTRASSLRFPLDVSILYFFYSLSEKEVKLIELQNRDQNATTRYESYAICSKRSYTLGACINVHESKVSKEHLSREILVTRNTPSNFAMVRVSLTTVKVFRVITALMYYK